MLTTLTDDGSSARPGPHVAVAVFLAAARRGRAMGIGAAPSRTAADDLAATALERARTRPDRVVVRGADRRAAERAGAVLAVLADLVRRRTAPGWDVVDVLVTGATQSAAARTLGVTRQAVSQRALAAGWRHQRDLAPLAADLLAAAQGLVPAADPDPGGPSGV